MTQKVRERMLVTLTACAVVVATAAAAQADIISMNITGFSFDYNGDDYEMSDRRDNTGGNLDPQEAEKLNTTEFMLDGNLVEQYSVSGGEDTYADLLIQNIVPALTLPTLGSPVSLSVGDNNGSFGFDWFYNDGSIVRNLRLNLDTVTVGLIYNGNPNQPTVSVSGTTSSWSQSNLPGLEFDSGSQISFTFTTSNTMVLIEDEVVTDMLATDGVLQLHGEGLWTEPQPPVQTVSLAVGESADWSFLDIPNPLARRYPQLPSTLPLRIDLGQLDAATNFDASEVAQTAQQLYANAGVENVVFDTQRTSETDVVVYFTSESAPVANMLGRKEFSRNERGEMEVIVFTNDIIAKSNQFGGDLSTNIAEVVAHEVAHAFGAFHSDSDPSTGGEIMDGTFASSDGLTPTFGDIAAPMTDAIFGGLTHNPKYTLQAVIDNEVDANLLPGTFDHAGLSELVTVSLNFGGLIDTRLRDVRILIQSLGFEGETYSQLSFFDEITLEELANQQLLLPRGSIFTIIASTVEAQDPNIGLLSSGPISQKLVALPSIGPQAFSLVAVDSDGNELTTIAEGTALATALPEPSTIVTVTFAATVLVKLGRRRVRGTKLPPFHR